MAEQFPFTVSGANVKIKIGSSTLAYGSDINYTLDIPHLPIEALGVFETVANEPIGYYVNGSFTITRYAKGGGAVVATPKDSNSVNAWVDVNGNLTLGSHFDPKKIIQSGVVDIEIIHQYTDSNKKLTDVSFLKITGCRLTQRSSQNINKRSMFTETYSFVGQILSDDHLSATSNAFTDLS